MSGLESAAALAVLLAVAWRGRARADDAGDGAARASEAAELAARATLRTVLGQLVSGDRNMRRAAARSVDTLGPGAISAMAAELARQRPGRPPAEIVAVLAKARGAADAADARDRLDAVLDVPDGTGPAYAQVVITLCLVRALAHLATPEAVAAFAQVALDARGAFAPACGAT